MLGILPPAALLGALGFMHAVPFLWAGLAVGGGLACGAVTAVLAARALGRQAEDLESIARAIESGRAPSHLIAAASDPLGRAERGLLEVADKVQAQLAALTEQRDEFEAILRGMSEAVVVTGGRGEVVLLNRAAREMFALSTEADYRGRDFVELCRDPRLQEFVARATRAPGGQMAGAELAIQTPAIRHLRVNAAPVRASPGAAAAWVLVFFDITQLKSYENLRTDFIANLTHELRTPLSALCGYAETLLAGVDDRDTQRRFLTIIERQSRRLARLLDDLISLSDLERGLTPLKIERLDPRRLVEEAAELMREAGRQRGVTLAVECAERLPQIAGDRDRIHQVLLNLLDNAIKYTPRGGHATAAARAATLDGAEQRPAIELIVPDTGEGIPAADIPRLTERFYRVDRARSRELGGTGLGLAIVKHIVNLHGGRLRIESRVREGTTVTVQLPAADAQAVPATAA